MLSLFLPSALKAESTIVSLEFYYSDSELQGSHDSWASVRVVENTIMLHLIIGIDYLNCFKNLIICM